MQQSHVFATGSWDDEENKVCMWHLKWDTNNSTVLEEEGPQGEPQLLCEAQHAGDVTDMNFLTQEHIAVASSTGTVVLYHYNAKTQYIEPVKRWAELHTSGGTPCPCTCVGTWADDIIVTGGEDGRITLLSPGHNAAVRILDKADSCTINGIMFLKQSEIVTVNSYGQLKLFDLRQNSDSPVQIFSATEDHLPLLCVDKHPGQAHIVATGGQDGMLTVWDLRQHRFPMTLLEAHTSSMWEVHFHPYHAEHIFTCSEDGSLWHWDGSALPSVITMKDIESGSNNEGHHTPWLGLDASRNKLEITSILPSKSLPVNSLNIDGSVLVCGTDSETIYSVNLPQLG
ncbi:hypothetical protein C0Q70_11250 [Pomacea canaliculata]|uniref:Uncharacterized protein n=2 Tax=Pomacea canaliculata TaxID=400727 RepID=A0A2T7P5H4_POMCA|nr:hypothetical protein C0Q70_11250 [Pomacea canaliculata]